MPVPSQGHSGDNFTAGVYIFYQCNNFGILPSASAVVRVSLFVYSLYIFLYLIFDILCKTV